MPKDCRYIIRNAKANTDETVPVFEGEEVVDVDVFDNRVYITVQICTEVES